jgi:hypothetical protein
MTNRIANIVRASISSRAVFLFLFAITSNVILAAVLPKVEWGTEATRIAASLAKGQGFSSPFSQPTGPSAWIPPIYPYLLAGIFRIFGVFTVSSYRVAIGFNIVLHASTCILLYRAAGEVFSTRVGWYAACALACFPLIFFVLLHVLGGYTGWSLFIPPNIIWYTHFSELAIVLLIWLTLHPPHWIVYGMAWGIVSLLNPAVLALAPAFVAWRLWQRESWRYVGLAVTVAALCVMPWLGRNYVVFHRLIFIRDNLGVELRVGNQVGQGGRWDSEVHPDRHPNELSRVVALGEAEYARAAGEDALRIIRAHPSEFVRNTILRMGYWWVGSPMKPQTLGRLQFFIYLPLLAFSGLAFYGAGRALRRKNRDAVLFLAVLFFYPLIYYVTHTFDSFFYQYPIHPVMLALATSAAIREQSLKRLEAREATGTPVSRD